MALPGMRDFNAQALRKRYYIINHIRSVFEAFGFEPLETPALEAMTSLVGQAGQESEQLLFKILDSNYQATLEQIAEKTSANDVLENIKKQPKTFSSKICQKGLRYDLTVPLARYAAANRDTIPIPFKRFQMQPVWRGERPQKGRYREFYQCDADVIGSDSLLFEAEIVCMIQIVFEKLGIKEYTIHCNHRKILNALIQKVMGTDAPPAALFQTIDKWDKIGHKGVEKLLQKQGYSENQSQELTALLSQSKPMEEWLTFLEIQINGHNEGKEGLDELRAFWEYAKKMNGTEKVSLCLHLARGLSYYTGMVFETTIGNVKMGSVSGGGRYANLTSSFGWQGVSGVGFSLGIDRIYDVMNELDLFPDSLEGSRLAMFVNFGSQSENRILELLSQMRAEGIGAEYYPSTAKLKKQLRYADKKKIAYVLFVGDSEIQQNTVSVKNMTTGETESVGQDDLVAYFKE